MKRRVAKVVRRILLLLLLGAILNVAVAWGCALESSHTTRDYRSFKGTDRPPSPYWACSGISHTFLGGRRIDLWHQYDHMGPKVFEAQLLDWLPQWASFVQPPDDYDLQRRTVTACGWPAYSLRGGVDESSRPTGAIVVPFIRSTPWPQIADVVLLPLLPIWPGFAINAVFFAAVLWLPFGMIGVARRARRIKRGLCQKCGYDLRGGKAGGHAVCPECGRAAT